MTYAWRKAAEWRSLQWPTVVVDRFAPLSAESTEGVKILKSMFIIIGTLSALNKLHRIGKEQVRTL